MESFATTRVLAGLLLLWAIVPAVDVRADDVWQVSIAADSIGAQAALGTAPGRKISADGRFVVFESSDPSLIAGGTDANGGLDVFLLDRLAGEVALVSHAHLSPTAAASGVSHQPVISADGLWVAFLSTGTDLIPAMVEDNSPTDEDLFLWSRASGLIRLVSHAQGLPSQTADGGSFEASISDDGRFLAFSSSSQSMIAQSDPNGASRDVFLFDRSAPAGSAVVLVSGVTQTGNAASFQSLISGDGGWVVFGSQATDLVAGTDGNGTDDVFLWERAAAGTPTSLTLLSHAAGMATTTGNGRSRSPVISADGAVVVFESTADDLVVATDGNGTEDVFVWRRTSSTSGTLTLASHVIGDASTAGDDSSGDARVAADGSGVVFESVAEDLVGASGMDGNGDEDVFFYSVATGTVTLVSRADGQPLTTANRGSGRAAISDDGSRIVFESFSTDLAAFTDDNATSDVFAWDSPTGDVTLLSHAIGQPTSTADGPSSRPEVSGDGRITAFGSLAADLVAGSHRGLYVVGATAPVSVAARRAPLRNLGATGLAFDSTVDFGRRQISDDGRYVVFTSEARHVVPGVSDANQGAADVFLLDTQTGVTVLVSHVPGQPLVAANSTSDLPELSADGAFVVFRSRAVDLVTPPLPNLFRNHIYLYEVATGTVRLVTHAPGLPNVAGNRTSDDARISADGRRIAVLSEASNLTAGTDLNLFLNDVFLYDVATDSTVRASNAAGGFSSAPVIDDGGDFVAFLNSSSALITGTDTNGTFDAFLFDRAAGTVRLVSHTIAGATVAGNGAASQVTISGDGSFVAFRSSADDMFGTVDANGAFTDIFLFERSTGDVRLVSHVPGSPTSTADRFSNNPVLSRDGSAVVYDSGARDLTVPVATDFFNDVFRYDVANDVNVRISRTSAGDVPFGNSTLPAVSSAGDRIVFSSTANDIVNLGGGNNTLPNLFLFDTTAATTSLVNRRFDGGGSGDATAERAGVAGDGSAVLFRSVGSDLMSMVDNVLGTGDVFLFTIAPTAADLGLTVVAMPTEVIPGGSVSFELTAVNASAHPAPRTVAVLELPEGAVFQSAQPADWSCIAWASTVVCDHDTPLTGTAPLLTIDAIMPLSPAPWTVRAAVKSLAPEADAVDNFDALTVTSPALDLGDAPTVGYPTSLAADGARHRIVGGLHLGTAVDADADGQPTAMADGDDGDGLDDEDGVTFSAPLLAGLASSVDIEVSAAGLLDAWFDWNADGDWDDPGEKAFDGLAVTAGTSSVALPVPLTAVVGETIARFRVSSAGAPLPTGHAADGEVEDHQLTVESAPSLTVDDVTFDEGDAGTTTFTFTVDLAPTAQSTVTVEFATVDGAATTADGDYQAATGTLTFAPGEAQKTIEVTVFGDTLEEPDEQFSVQLTNPSEAILGDGVGLGSIDDDDDQGAPVVTGAATHPDQIPIESCGDVRSRFGRLDVAFDQPMRDPPGDAGADDVTNPGNYRLLLAGPDADFSTSDCGVVQGDDLAVAIPVVTWSSATAAAALHLANDAVDGLYRLIACPDLRDLTGNMLDGNGDGTGGDPFIRTFRLSHGNLFVNGHFDDCQPISLAPWDLVTAGGNQVVPDTSDVDGSSLSGSALALVSDPSPTALRQCVEASVEGRYRLAADLRFQPMAAATATMVLACELFASPACGGPPLGEQSTSTVLSPGQPDWQHIETVLAPSPNTVSALCRAEVTPDNPSDPSFDLSLDALSLVDTVIFVDGFETGNSSAWSVTVP